MTFVGAGMFLVFAIVGGATAASRHSGFLWSMAAVWLVASMAMVVIAIKVNRTSGPIDPPEVRAAQRPKLFRSTVFERADPREPERYKAHWARAGRMRLLMFACILAVALLSFGVLTLTTHHAIALGVVLLAGGVAAVVAVPPTWSWNRRHWHDAGL